MNQTNSRSTPPLPSCSLVVTTIGRGEFLSDYFDAVRRERALERVDVIVIPDRKTPAELYDRCAEFARKGLRLECPTVEEQDAYLAHRGLSGFIPYNSDNRRNIGYLMALERGSDFVISIDDDNYCRPGEDFFAEHAVVCTERTEGVCVDTPERFFNICDLMEIDRPAVYPRGYPYRHRHGPVNVTRTQDAGPVRINAGLWLNEPDLDAMTWLVAGPVRATGFKGESVLLGDNAWTPINTQNTALHRDVVAAYYFARMGYPLAGMSIDRYGDILSGYFAQACVRHMRHRIRVGTPLADHRRNTHNYMKDATHEMGCVWLIEDLADWLADLKLQGSTYHETYLSLAAELDDVAERFTGFIWTDATRGYLHQTAWCMRRWANACATVKGGAVEETAAVLAA
jgi:glycosyltransferase involved in cell wall biosynthesis